MENAILIYNLFFLVRLCRNSSSGDKNIIHWKIYWNQVPKCQLQSDSCNNTLPSYLKFKTSQEATEQPRNIPNREERGILVRWELSEPSFNVQVQTTGVRLGATKNIYLNIYIYCTIVHI